MLLGLSWWLPLYWPTFSFGAVGSQSNCQTFFSFATSPADGEERTASKAYTTPSPPAKNTSGRPPISPSDGDDQVLWKMHMPMCSWSVATSRPVFLSMTTRLGALGASIFLCVSSTPLAVQT